VKRSIPIVAAIVLVLALALPLSSAPRNMGDGSTTWTWERGNAISTKLENKDAHWNEQVGDGRWGWLTHGKKMTDGNFDGQVEVKGMDPDSWYLVTLYSDDCLTAYYLGQVGYYGFVTKDAWADIALFQTDAEGNAKIDLPYTSPALDPNFGTLEAPVLPTGEYKDVTVAIKYVGTGATPDWGLVITGGHPTPDPGNQYNLYEMKQLNFTIWEKLALVHKDPSDWSVISRNGELVFKNGPEFCYKFEGWDLELDTPYSLIYFADGWPGNNPGALIAEGTTDGDGKLKLEGCVDLGMSLPHPSDANYALGAKIWLVPSACYNTVNKAVTNWQPARFLFEANYITYDNHSC